MVQPMLLNHQRAAPTRGFADQGNVESRQADSADRGVIDTCGCSPTLHIFLNNFHARNIRSPDEQVVAGGVSVFLG
jgi:hypothetical protein